MSRRSHAVRYFLEGLVFLLPLLLTVGIIIWIVRFLQDFLGLLPEHVLLALFPRTADSPFWQMASRLAVYLGTGVVIFFVVALFGFVLQRSIGRRLAERFSAWVRKIPGFKTIYDPIRQILESILSGGNKERFKRVVMIEYPRKGLYTFGFVTAEMSRPDAASRILTVFVPSSPNPTTGWMVMVPETDVVATKLSVESALKLILSGGMVVNNRDELYHTVESIESR